MGVVCVSFVSDGSLMGVTEKHKQGERGKSVWARVCGQRELPWKAC